MRGVTSSSHLCRRQAATKPVRGRQCFVGPMGVERGMARSGEHFHHRHRRRLGVSAQARYTIDNNGVWAESWRNEAGISAARRAA